MRGESLNVLGPFEMHLLPVSVLKKASSNKIENVLSIDYWHGQTEKQRVNLDNFLCSIGKNCNFSSVMSCVLKEWTILEENRGSQVKEQDNNITTLQQQFH